MEQNRRLKLFTEFPPVSRADWEEKIREDLKGADFEKKLVWKTCEGFDVRPFYMAEDLERCVIPDAVPGVFPYLRGNRPAGNQWEIRQELEVVPSADNAAHALEMLEKGAGSLCLVPYETCMHDLDKGKHAAIDEILKVYPLESHGIHFRYKNGIPGHISNILLDLLLDEARRRDIGSERLTASLDTDPLSILSTEGIDEPRHRREMDMLTLLLSKVVARTPGIRVLTIHGSLFHNCGASVVQQLAFSLAAAIEYLSFFTGKGYEVDDIARTIQFEFAAGSGFFMEIAGLRAARLLWSAVVNAYRPASPCSTRMNIHTVTSSWNKTIYDPYVNMLRTTTEAMSAVLGGTGSLTVRPFDDHFRSPSDISIRYARNTQIILREEAGLARVADPAAGSYYVETLTSSIADEAWKLLVETEKEGGYVEALRKGFIQDSVERTANERTRNILSGRDILIGINRYPNPDERMEPEIQDHSEGRVTTKKAGSRVLRPCRASQAFEEMRLRTEQKSPAPPRVFLFTYGNPAIRKARASFATGFMACAGFTIIDNPGFTSVDEGVKACLDQKPDIVVICSSDEEYPAIVPSICEALKNNAVLALAGYPQETAGRMREAGIKHFIYLHSNILETLEAIQEELGIL